jgi:hypothetical protein
MNNFAICGNNLKTTEIPEGKNAQLGSIRREVKETEKAWLAGVIEGEGCLAIVQNFDKHGKGRYNTVRIGVTNGDLFLIKKVSEIFYNLNAVFCYQYRTSKNPKHQSRIDIIAEGQGSCRKILEAILPYMASKKTQVELLLEFISWRANSKFEENIGKNYKEELSKLKHNFPDPSQTTRRASRPLVLDGDIVGAYTRV